LTFSGWASTAFQNISMAEALSLGLGTSGDSRRLAISKAISLVFISFSFSSVNSAVPLADGSWIRTRRSFFFIAVAGISLLSFRPAIETG